MRTNFTSPVTGKSSPSVRTFLENPETLDAGMLGLLFDCVIAAEWIELARAIAAARPDLSGRVVATYSKRKDELNNG